MTKPDERHHSMTHSQAGLRRARWGAAMAIAAVSLLTFTAGANAAIFHPVDGPTFQAAVTTANTNGPGRDTIVMPNFLIPPLSPVTITNDLLITSDHGYQAVNDLPVLDGSSVSPPDADFVTINSGATVHMEGFQISVGSTDPSAVLKNFGTLYLDNMLLNGNAGRPLDNPGSAIVTNTTIDQNFTLAVFSVGSLIMTNSAITRNSGG